MKAKLLTIAMTTLMATSAMAGTTKTMHLDSTDHATHINLYKSVDTMKIVRNGDTCWVEVTKNGETVTSKETEVTKARFNRSPLKNCLSKAESDRLASNI